jgi:assimilatory nitrate reductase catalytic subunit
MGRLCQKGFNALAHTVHPERVLQPLRKSKASSPFWSPAAWPEALDDIAARIRRIQEQYGPDSVAVFGGGSLTNEVCYLLGKFTRVALRSRYVDYNGRYCMSSAAAAQQLAFGIDRGLPFPLEDIPQTDYLILAGTNIAECQPTLMPYLLAAKKKGAVIVTIDPRRTMTSKIAQHQLMIEPGQDSLLVSGLLHVILEEKLYDAEFVAAHTEGVEAVQEAVRDFPPERVAALTGIPEDTIREVARGFAGAKRGMVLTARGLEQQVNGVEHTLQYINLCLLCGHIGQPGSGFGSVTGQANGQGGREHGLKADQLPGYRSIEDPDARAHVAQVWGIDPHELPGKGVSAYELFGKILDGDIKAMMILGSNPVVSSPNNARVAEALAKLDLLVVVDLFETETAAYADWLLPGTSFLEVEGTMTNLEGRVFYRPRVFEPAGAAMPDAWLLCALAERLGRGRYFSYSSMSEVFDELCRASAGGKADYSGISYSRLQEAQGLFWPCPGPGQAPPRDAAPLPRRRLPPCRRPRPPARSHAAAAGGNRRYGISVSADDRPAGRALPERRADPPHGRAGEEGAGAGGGAPPGSGRAASPARRRPRPLNLAARVAGGRRQGDEGHPSAYDVCPVPLGWRPGGESADERCLTPDQPDAGI